MRWNSDWACLSSSLTTRSWRASGNKSLAVARQRKRQWRRQRNHPPCRAVTDQDKVRREEPVVLPDHPEPDGSVRCNAFTIECFKFCCSRLPDRWQITPCLIHALFRDRGMASACQGDLGVLLAMRMLLSVSGKSCHMGNTYKRGTDTFVVEHASPAIKMNGFDQPGCLPTGHFVSKGWGTKVIVDFKNNREKTVTVARVDPSAKKVLVLLGEIVDSHGWCKDKSTIGCANTAFIRPLKGSADEFLRRRLDYGNHFVWVYGDYTQSMQRLGELLKLEVEMMM